MDILLKIYKAVANQQRLNIIKLLIKHKELSVSEISRRIGKSIKTTSTHLSQLEKVGLIKFRKKWPLDLLLHK
jgi:DNA-binding transcriptional ArsR family regulator